MSARRLASAPTSMILDIGGLDFTPDDARHVWARALRDETEDQIIESGVELPASAVADIVAHARHYVPVDLAGTGLDDDAARRVITGLLELIGAGYIEAPR